MQVLRVHDQITVRYDSLFEEGTGSHLEETLSSKYLRPQPPDPTKGWLKGVKEGSPLELQHDGGWWHVKLVSPAGEEAASAPLLLVHGKQWGEENLQVETAKIRPGWSWSEASNTWSSGAEPKASAARGGSKDGRGAAAGRGASGRGAAGRGGRGKK